MACWPSIEACGNPVADASRSVCQRLLEAPHKRGDRQVEGGADRSHLQHIEPPLPCLDLGEDRLRHTEPAGKVALLQACREAHLSEQRPEAVAVPPCDVPVAGAPGMNCRAGDLFST